MNIPVSLEVKQLLFNKGWRYELGLDETGHRVKHSLAEERWNQGHLNYVDIIISDVVMWLYEKHGIWINVSITIHKEYFYQCMDTTGKKDPTKNNYPSRICEPGNYYNSPTEAYEAAIEYTLNNLI